MTFAESLPEHRLIRAKLSLGIPSTVVLIGYIQCVKPNFQFPSNDQQRPQPIYNDAWIQLSVKLNLKYQHYYEHRYLSANICLSDDAHKVLMLYTPQ